MDKDQVAVDRLDLVNKKIRAFKLKFKKFQKKLVKKRDEMEFEQNQRILFSNEKDADNENLLEKRYYIEQAKKKLYDA